MSWNHSVRFRLTPFAGPAVVYDLTGWTVVSSFAPCEPLHNDVELIDRSMDQVRGYGFRQTVSLAVDFYDDVAADVAREASFVEILSRSEDEDWSVEISLDSGATYKRVLLNAHTEAEVAGSKRVGIGYNTTWTVAAALLTKPAALGGAW